MIMGMGIWGQIQPQNERNTSNSPGLLQNQISSCWCFKTALMLTLSWKKKTKLRETKSRLDVAQLTATLKSTHLTFSVLKSTHFTSAKFACELCVDNQTPSQIFRFFVPYVNSLLSCYHFIKPSQQFSHLFKPQRLRFQSCGSRPGPWMREARLTSSPHFRNDLSSGGCSLQRAFLYIFIFFISRSISLVMNFLLLKSKYTDWVKKWNNTEKRTYTLN